MYHVTFSLLGIFKEFLFDSNTYLIDNVIKQLKY